MIFYYKAIDKNGKKLSGEINGKNRFEINSILINKGIQPYLIQEKKLSSKSLEKKAKQRGLTNDRNKLQEKIKLKKSQIILFTEELSELIDSGIQLEFALKLMEHREANPTLKIFCISLREQIIDGKPLSQALQLVSSSFDKLYCNLALAGETSGTLGAILQRQAKYLNNIAELRSKVLFSMIYPLFLLGSGIAVSILFMTYLVPKLAHLIETTGSELPLAATFLIFISNFLKNWGWIILLIIIILSLIFIFSIKKPDKQLWWDGFKLKLPFFGKILTRNLQAQFLQTLSTLVNSRISLDKSLQLVAKASPNLHHKDIVKIIANRVKEGSSLSKSMKNSNIFSPFAIDIITIGEQTGNLGKSLTNANKKTEKLLNQEIEKISALAQPVIIIALALIVGVMAYLMISVIYETIGSLRKH